MQQFKEIQSETFSASTPYNREFQGKVFNALSVKLSGTVAASVSPAEAIVTDPQLKLLQNYELTQGETPLISAGADKLYWLGAMIEGEPGRYVAPGTFTTAESFAGAFTLDFNKLLGPAGMVDARGTKVFTRGTFNTIASYVDSGGAGVMSAISATLRQNVRTTDRVPKEGAVGFIQPKIYQVDVDMSASSTNIQHTVRFEEDLFVPIIMVQAFDSSANTTLHGSRSNGLIKNLRVDLQAGDLNGEIFRKSWGMALEDTWKGSAFGGAHFESADIGVPYVHKPNGVIAIPLVDDQNPDSRIANGARLFRRGDSLTFTFDTSSTVEGEFTGVTAASGDLAHIVVAGGKPRTTSPGTDISAVNEAPGAATSVRSNIARAQRAGVLSSRRVRRLSGN